MANTLCTGDHTGQAPFSRGSWWSGPAVHSEKLWSVKVKVARLKTLLHAIKPALSTCPVEQHGSSPNAVYNVSPVEKTIIAHSPTRIRDVQLKDADRSYQMEHRQALNGRAVFGATMLPCTPSHRSAYQ
jgi:hypothetical protein